jgi:SAM-dependent methyltransferase
MSETEYRRAVARAYADGARGYAASWRTTHPWLETARAEFRRRLPPNGSVIDVGCGPGHDSAAFAAAGFRVLGVDFCPEMVAVAAANYPSVRFRVWDLLSDESPGPPFDGAWASYVLVHVPASLQARAVSRLHAVLAPGGTAFVAAGVGDRTEEAVRPIAGLVGSGGAELEPPSTRVEEGEFERLLDRWFTVAWKEVVRPLEGRGAVFHAVLSRRAST